MKVLIAITTEQYMEGAYKQYSSGTVCTVLWGPSYYYEQSLWILAKLSEVGKSLQEFNGA